MLSVKDTLRMILNRLKILTDRSLVLPNYFDPDHTVSGISNRPASANIELDNTGNVKHFLATSSMTTGKPKADGNILSFAWDNGNRWHSQLALLHDAGLQYRYCDGNGDWGVWQDVYGDYTPATGLGRTYTSNTAVTQEQFNRIYAWKFGRLLVIQGNLSITSLPKSSAETTIGYINNTGTILFSGSVQVPCGTAGTVNVSIAQSGNNVRVGLYNYANTTASGWCRFNMVIILA